MHAGAAAACRIQAQQIATAALASGAQHTKYSTGLWAAAGTVVEAVAAASLAGALAVPAPAIQIIEGALSRSAETGEVM